MQIRYVKIISLLEKNPQWKPPQWLSMIVLMCFVLYLINVFAKSTMAERWTDVMFKLTFCLSVTVEDLNL